MGHSQNLKMHSCGQVGMILAAKLCEEKTAEITAHHPAASLAHQRSLLNRTPCASSSLLEDFRPSHTIKRSKRLQIQSLLLEKPGKRLATQHLRRCQL